MSAKDQLVAKINISRIIEKSTFTILHDGSLGIEVSEGMGDELFGHLKDLYGNDLGDNAIGYGSHSMALPPDSRMFGVLADRYPGTAEKDANTTTVAYIFENGIKSLIEQGVQMGAYHSDISRAVSARTSLLGKYT